MDPDTAIGGPDARFPETRRTALDRVREDNPGPRRMAEDAIIAAYWKPVYKYIRVRWRETNEDAKDLTQGFFTAAIASGTFGRYDANLSAFRTFVRLCVDRHVSRSKQFAKRFKRSAPTECVDECVLAGGCDPEELFHREWVREMFAASLAQLREQVRPEVWRAFELCQLGEEPHSYREIAATLGVPVTQVTNYIAAARRDLRRIVLARVRAVTGSDAEYRSAVACVLGGGVR